MRRERLIVQQIHLLVFPQIAGVVVVGYSLTQISVEKVKTLPVRMARRFGTAQSPLAYAGSSVSGVLEHGSNGFSPFEQRTLAFQSGIVPDITPFRQFIIIPDIILILEKNFV